MAEQIVNGYKRLFEVRLLHHYWLDEGPTMFDAIPDPAKKDRRLLTYDVRSFLSVVPTTATEQRLKGLRCVFKATALGFVVAVPALAEIPDDTLFEFVLTVQNSDFFNYTALTLRPQKIYELYHQPEDKTYRYKENVPVFYNLYGTRRGTDDLYLSNEFGLLSGSDQVEAFILLDPDLSISTLWQLTSDQPGETTQQIGAAATKAEALPVFYHQGDAPVLPVPAGLAGVPARGIELTNDIPEAVFGLIRIAAVHPTKPVFSCTTAQLAKAKAPVFQIRFKNRSTIWKYYDKRVSPTENPDNALSIEANPLPLTFFGNPSPSQKQKPSTGLVKPADPSALPKVTGLVSEIFI